MKIDLEHKREYKVMVYPYIVEKINIGDGDYIEEKYKQYHSNSLWQYDGFTHEDFLEILEFLKDLKFRREQALDKVEDKE